MATQLQYPKSARKRATSSSAVQHGTIAGRGVATQRSSASESLDNQDINVELEAAKRQLAFLPFLKEKFDELVKEHADSKARYANKTGQLKETLAELQSKVNAFQNDSERFRAENLAKSSEISRLGCELASLRSAKGAVEQQLKETRLQCKQGAQDRAGLLLTHEGIYAHLQDILQHRQHQTAVISQHASSSMEASRQKHLARVKTLQDSNACSDWSNLRLERKVKDKDDQVSQLVDLIIQSEEEQSTYESRIEELEDDLEQCQQMRRTDGQLFLNERRDLNQQLRQAFGSISELIETHRAEKVEWSREKGILEQEVRHIQENLLDQEQALEALPRISMAKYELEASLTNTQFDLEEAQKLLSTREDEINVLREQLQEAQDAEEALGSELAENKQSLASTEQELVNEREQRRHLTSLLMQSQATETQLQDDIFSLQNDLVSYVQLQETHADLIKNLDRLMRTADLAEEDVKELARMNSELAGHNNPNQRIRQLDRLRTELAELKKKHVSNQAELSAQKGKIASLEAEVSAYKSVDQNRPVIAKHVQPLRASTNLPAQRPLQDTGFGRVSLRKGNTLVESDKAGKVTKAVVRPRGPVRSFLS